ncbi:MAG: nucleoside hydrolase, partial [Eubacterium sp.]|nr:nucleoside hydrolase [Eubacterium sp.]
MASKNYDDLLESFMNNSQQVYNDDKDKQRKGNLPSSYNVRNSEKRSDRGTRNRKPAPKQKPPKKTAVKEKSAAASFFGKLGKTLLALIMVVGVVAVVHGSDGLGEMHLPDPKHRPEKEHAVDALVRLIMDNPGELELITLGPLTNVALAFLKEPAIAKNVKKLWIMGGTGMDQGNATPAAEFNIYVDPEAADIVL